MDENLLRKQYAQVTSLSQIRVSSYHSAKMQIYTSEKHGCDTTGDGTEKAPLKTVLQALIKLDGKVNADTRIWVDGVGDETWDVVSKSKLKKVMKTYSAQARKQEKGQHDKTSSENGDVSNHLSEAMEVHLTLDTTLPKAQQCKIRELQTLYDKRVHVFGWVHRIRRQSKTLMFIILRDGTGFLQCVFSNNLCLTQDAIALSPESTIEIYGTIKQLPAGKSAPGGIELLADYWSVIGKAPAGGVDSVLTAKSDIDTQLDNRHLVIRGENTTKVLRLLSIALSAFRAHYADRQYVEITPPTFVKGQVEGGPAPFSLNYYGQNAYMSQTSQFYLETCIPALGDCFSIARSYRAEKSSTRRHLSEYNHVEAECPFIDLNGLLERIEDLVVDVCERIMKKAGDLLLEVNPGFKVPKRPFKRLKYVDAIAHLNSLGIKKEDLTPFQFGDEITEAPERQLVDSIGEPVLVTHFPTALKVFYMLRTEGDRSLTDSVDLLVPGVGEVVGGAMRIEDADELMNGYKSDDVNPEFFYWYTDQRKFGTCPHGGYGLGFERFLTWLLGKDHIRDVCLFPRFTGRCRP
ncbi:unnamed protein product [Trichobilharzia szidati]|nr:unnamed protein product [Trichobilharzia szidati]